MHATAPANMLPIWQPNPADSSKASNPSVYKQNKTGLSTQPCFTPLLTLKDCESQPKIELSVIAR